jgi:hypothetical protein
MNITGSEKYVYANETYYTESEWDLTYGGVNDVVFIDFFGNLRNDTDVYKTESFFYDINGQKFNGTYVDVLDDQFNSGNMLEVFDTKMEWDTENGGYKDYGYFEDYGDMSDYDGMQSYDDGYYNHEPSPPPGAPTYPASPSSAQSSRHAAHKEHRDSLQIAGIHQGVRKRRETDLDNDNEEEDEDFDETGGYDESILEGHEIHPLGCGHKAIEGALKHRNRLLGFLIALIVPYFLAFIAACTHLSSLKREHTYEVEECEEQVTVLPTAMVQIPKGMVQIVNTNVNKK